MTEFVDFITIRPELLDENGEPTGQPDPVPGVAATAGGTRVTAEGREFLCRVRALPDQLPEGVIFHTEEDFKTEHPDLWTAFGMEPVEVETEEGTITVEPMVPVFL